MLIIIILADISKVFEASIMYIFSFKNNKKFYKTIFNIKCMTGNRKSILLCQFNLFFCDILHLPTLYSITNNNL